MWSGNSSGSIMDGLMSDFFLKFFEISSNQGNYSVDIAPFGAMKFAQNSIAITDNCPEVMKCVDFSIFSHVFPIKANESMKNMESCVEILGKLAERGVKRDSVIYAIGGGIIQDISTLASSLYMRGLAWCYVPTTLVSMLDSCIGGKSSINLGKFKNIVGNFYPPSKIQIDSRFVDSLPSVDISSGISEGLKIAFAKSPEIFTRFSESIRSWRDTQNSEHLDRAISISLQAKKWFIEIDEYDQKERKLLNFGHSFGHALESASRFAIPHGIAVLIGMRAAVYESKNVRSCNELVKSIHEEMSFSQFKDIPVQISRVEFISALSRDKKNSNSSQVLILPNESGRLEIVSRPLSQQNLESCWDSIAMALEESELSFEIL